MKPGIYPGTDEGTYFGLPYLNSSALKLASKSLAHVKASQDGRLKFKESEYTDFGTLCHLMALEPDRVDAKYITDPGAEAFLTDKGEVSTNYRATKAYKQWCGSHAGMKVISREDLERAKRCVDALYANETAAAWLAGEGDNECSFVWEDPDTGVICKGRADRMGDAMMDLKFCQDIFEFEKTIVRRDYILQAAFYRMGIRELTGETKPFVLIPVEADEPHGVMAAPFAPSDLDRAEARVKRYLRGYADALKSGQWPGYQAPTYWSLPSWAPDAGPVKWDANDEIEWGV